MNDKQKIKQLENRISELEKEQFQEWYAKLGGFFKDCLIISNGKTSLKVSGSSICIYTFCEALNKAKIKSR